MPKTSRLQRLKNGTDISAIFNRIHVARSVCQATMQHAVRLRKMAIAADLDVPHYLLLSYLPDVSAGIY